ncbi:MULTISPECIES: hypothetical protein [unclassified Bradyrhizobium]|uniref:hypothetical protein n=1 Tax=unclassified Bradyrhizobium TaxID=2631580 RepID=UPI0028E24039|nr:MULTISPECIES: hypothetical protein [unclassified Bradyrhizobium]
MLKTLGLDDELDPAEVVIEIERAFDIKILDAEAENIFSVGQMFDLLRSKVHCGDADRKCASAMAFYRIRRALNDLPVDIGQSPSSNLSPLHRVYTKSFVKSLEEKSGLRLPRPDLSLVGRFGVTLIALVIFGAVAALLLALCSAIFSVPLPKPLSSAAGPLLVGGLVAGLVLVRGDAGRLPKTCRTLGTLAAKTANLSYGRLVKQGADARDSHMWRVLVEILSDYARVPTNQIVRETYFLASTLKTQDTAA